MYDSRARLWLIGYGTTVYISLRSWYYAAKYATNCMWKAKIEWIVLQIWKCYLFSPFQFHLWSWTHIQQQFYGMINKQSAIATVASLDWRHVAWPKWAIIPRVTGHSSLYNSLAAVGAPVAMVMYVDEDVTGSSFAIQEGNEVYYRHKLTYIGVIYSSFSRVCSTTSTFPIWIVAVNMHEASV